MSLFSRIKRVLRGVFKETTLSDLYGTPVSDRELNYFNGRPITSPGNTYGPEIFKDKLQTVRTLQELNRLRHISRALYERNPNAAGGINGCGRYVIGCGSAVTVQSTKDDQEPPVRLSQVIENILTEFKLANLWATAEREIYRRFLTDGECFIQLTPMDDGVTAMRFIEPDQVVPPSGESHEGRWSWGILTDPDRPGRVLAYNVRDYATHTERQVPAVFIKHLKRGSNLNQKRGLPALTSAIDELTGGAKLRHASREGEKVRASIAYVRQHATAPLSAITSLQSANATGTYEVASDNGTRTVTYQEIEPGTVQDIPEGLEYQAPPPSPNSEAAAQCIRLSLEAVAAALEIPYWMVSGDNTTSSYASSLTTESPFVKMIESDQDVLANFIDDVLTAVIEIAAEQERDDVPDDVLTKIDLAVTFTSPVVRNLLEETQRNQILNQMGVKSRQTIAGEEGLDWEAEQKAFAEENPITVMPVVGGGTPQTAGGQMQRDMEAVK